MGRMYTILLLSLLALYQAEARPYALGRSPCPAIEVVPSHTAAALDLEVWQSESSRYGYVLVVSEGSSELDHLARSVSGVCKGAGSPTGRKTATVGNAMLKKCGLSPKTNGTAHADWEDETVLCIQNESAEPLAFLVGEAELRSLCLHESLRVELSCNGPPTMQCYTLTLQASSASSAAGSSLAQKGEGSSRRVFRRHANSQVVGEDRSTSPAGVPVLVVGVVVVGVVWVGVLVAALAMCGGKKEEYSPSHGERARREMSEVAEPAPEVMTVPAAVTPLPAPAAAAAAEVSTHADSMQVLETNGPTSPTVSQDKETSGSRESVEHKSTGSSRDATERGRSLSARSFDPLPEVPKLEVVGPEGNKEDDDEDDDPYAVVPAEDIDRMPDSDSDEDNRNEVDAGPPKPPGSSSPFPPYGKVSRHGKPQSEPKEVEDDSDSYAEVRDVIRRGPLSLTLRERSQTQPADLPNLPSPRDKRSLTDSGSATHMPLPDIPPTGPLPVVIPEEETIMYDSIPEQDRKPAPTAARPTTIKRKERLYESVEEMEDRDLYESVPDSLSKMDQPPNPGSPSTPSLPPKLLPADPPMTPQSPIPSRRGSEHEQQAKKKALEKTLSASTSEEGKRRFSFFGRKKAGSVSSAKPKKPIDQQPESPTALTLSGSPQHKSPPLPNIPIPPRPDEEEEEEDTYDKVTPSLSSAGIVHTDAFQHDDARSKSMSLPVSYRTGGGAGGGGGGRPNLPLPRLPEDSGSATVQHERVMEGTGGPDDYDMVHNVERIPDEPNYDTVEVQRFHHHVPSAEDPDPPYDKIDKQELQEIRDREMQREKLNSPSSATGSNGPEDPGLPPDHDEEGYAVVPEEIRMRKRAMSASQGARQLDRELSPNSMSKGYDVIRHHDDEQPYNTIPETRSHTVSSPLQSTSGKSSRGSEEDQYASVDMVAKQEKKKKELEEALRMQEELRGDRIGTSPVPPPLPPALNPDDLDEFKEPPIPQHLEGMDEVVNGELEVPPRDTTADPPYAKVRSNPYAEVGSRPYAEVDIDYFQNQAGVRPVADSQASGTGGPSADEVLEDEAGYDVIGAVAKKPVQQEKKKEDKPYDTIQDVRVYMEGGPSHTEQETPTLETAESANIYDSLLPSPPPQDADEEEEEDVRYEVIDTKRETPRSMV